MIDQGVGVEVKYISPLARAQRASQGVAVMRWLEAIGPMGQLDPGIFDNVDADEVARHLAEAYGVHTSLLRDPKQVAEIRADRARQQQQQALLATAEPVSNAAKSGVEAMQMAGLLATPAQGAA